MAGRKDRSVQLLRLCLRTGLEWWPGKLHPELKAAQQIAPNQLGGYRQILTTAVQQARPRKAKDKQIGSTTPRQLLQAAQRVAAAGSVPPAVPEGPDPSTAQPDGSRQRRGSMAAKRKGRPRPDSPAKRQATGSRPFLPPAAAAAAQAAEAEHRALQRRQAAKAGSSGRAWPAAAQPGAAEQPAVAQARSIQLDGGTSEGQKLQGRPRRAAARARPAELDGDSAGGQKPHRRLGRHQRARAAAQKLAGGDTPVGNGTKAGAGSGGADAGIKPRGSASNRQGPGDRPASAKDQSSQGQSKASKQPPAKLPSYQELLKMEAVPDLKPDQHQAVLDHVLHFTQSKRAQDQALALYVNAQMFQRTTGVLQSLLLAHMTPDLADSFTRAEMGTLQEQLFDIYAEYVLEEHRDELQAYKERVNTVDMRKSHLWYPVARALERRIVYHAGPTNSGKTYEALQAMKAAEAGLYCGPLRLLAMEVYDALNAEGTPCNLVTGQERTVLPGASHMSCTVEMTSMRQRFDVAVLDEIQLIGDQARGHAWTRALQGIPANEIHLCGDQSALNVVRQLCDFTNEALEVKQYQRFGELEIEQQHLVGGYSNVQPGDCIVAFSRKDIFEIKEEVERTTDHKVCVVYGALPPEMRRQQARLFNETGNGYDVLVASDAVGMGLNLNIRRIVFHTLQKYEGREMVPVSISQIKQIAGRAGRRNSIYPKGYATTLQAADLPRVKAAVDAPMSALGTQAAGLFPEFQHLELLGGQVPEDTLAQLLQRFNDEARLEGTYFFAKQDSLLKLANLVERIDNLSLEDRYKFCLAPVNVRDPRQAAALLHFAVKYAKGLPVTLDIHIPTSPALTAEGLRELEAIHQVVSLWIWLSFRFDNFLGQEEAIKTAETVVELMEISLVRLGQHLQSLTPEQQADMQRQAVQQHSGASAPKKLEALLLGQDPMATAYLKSNIIQKQIQRIHWHTPKLTKLAQAAA